MLAVIKTGGKQYLVKEGDVLIIEKLGVKPGKKIEFKEILLLSNEKGENFKLGNPFISGVKVKMEVLEEKKGKKILIIKYKPKTRYRRKRGHRQSYTKVKILKILTEK